MLFKIEIVFFILSFSYIVYFVGSRLRYFLKRIFASKDHLTQKQFSKGELRQHSKKQVEKIVEDIENYVPEAYLIKPDSFEKINDIKKRVEVNISRGYIDSAIHLLVEGLAIKKDDKTLNLLLADIYEKQGKYKSAGLIYEDLLEYFSSDPEIYVKLAKVYESMDNHDLALSKYEKAIELNIDDEESIESCAYIALELKRFNKAQRYASKLLKTKPRDPNMLGLKGYCYEKQGKSQEAIGIYNKLVELQPYNSEIIERLKRLQEKT